MPELPEVETTRAGIAPYLNGETVERVTVRQSRLRYPVPSTLARKLKGQVIRDVLRRGKYLVFKLDQGSVLIHLGMSGSLRIVEQHAKPGKHDHVDFVMQSGWAIRYTDPRKFGLVLWGEGDAGEHSLLAKLGVEPLTRAFSATYFYKIAQRRKVNIKALLMNSHVVVGVGNIYASEALFIAGIDPRTPAVALQKEDCQRVVKAVKQVLKKAIKAGGTTLKDFVNGQGQPGHFQQQLYVYGRVGMDCYVCGREIQKCVLAQRSTFYCSQCQSLLGESSE